jgi:hypothetical protein
MKFQERRSKWRGFWEVLHRWPWDFALRYATDPKMDTRRVPRLCAGNGRPPGGRPLSQRATMFVLDRKSAPGFYPSSEHDHSDPSIPRWPMDLRRSPRSFARVLEQASAAGLRGVVRDSAACGIGGSAASRNRNWNGGCADLRQQPPSVDLFGFTVKAYVALGCPKRQAGGRIQ